MATKSRKTLAMMIMVIMMQAWVGQADDDHDHHHQMAMKDQKVMMFETAAVVGGLRTSDQLSSEKIKWKCFKVVGDIYSCAKEYFKNPSKTILGALNRECCNAAAKTQDCLPALLKLIPNYDPELVKVSCALIGIGIPPF